MNRNRVIRGEAGFTLIEVMITLVVLSIGLMALGGLQSQAIKFNASSKRMTVATAIAEARLEQIKDMPYANVQSESAATVAVSSMNFTRQVTVTANSPLPNTKTVLVSVTWTEGSRSRTVPVSTVMSQL